MRVLPVRDDLFLLAHDDAGKLVVPEASIEVGLAGATLIDLLLQERVGVVAGRLAVIADGPTDSVEADTTLGAIAANTDRSGPRAWVSWISHGAYKRAAADLSARGVITHSTTRRLGLLPATRCVPVRAEDLVRVRSRVRFALPLPGRRENPETPEAGVTALCGLIRVLRLESSLLLSVATSDLLLALERMTVHNDVTVRQVTAAVDRVITTAASR